MSDQIDETIRLNKSKRKMVLLFIISAGFVELGIVMLKSNEFLLGWVTTIFFGSGLVVSVLSFIPNSAYIVLTSEGIKAKELFKSYTIKWQDIQEFKIYELPGFVSSKLVGYDYSDSYKKQNNLRAFSKGFTGVEAGLSDNYGYKAEKLASLLNTWRQKYGNAG